MSTKPRETQQYPIKKPHTPEPFNKFDIYLAAPFTHDDPKVRVNRLSKVNQLAAYLIEHGFSVFSPLSHSAPLVPYFTNPDSMVDFSSWGRIDITGLYNSHIILVFCLADWELSTGVDEERIRARDFQIPEIRIYETDNLTRVISEIKIQLENLRKKPTT